MKTWDGTKKAGYPTDVSDEEWALCVPYPVLLREDARQRVCSFWVGFNAVRYLAKAGCGWRTNSGRCSGRPGGATDRNDHG